MFHMMKHKPVMFGAVVLMVAMAMAQSQHERETLSVQGYRGQASVIRYQGRVFVDAQALAQITNGSLSFEKNRIILTLPDPDGSSSSGDAHTSGFSRPFIKAAIEAMASIREWGGTLQAVVLNGYPVGNTTAGNTIMAFEGRAADSVALASAAASTDSDYRGLELLKNEFNNVQDWADRYVKARSSLSAADLSMSESQFNNDSEAQKIIHCGQFLAQMFASGNSQDDAACH
ncbi:MAG: hypothetical protein WCF61_11085 [Terriglobales bacterium]